MPSTPAHTRRESLQLTACATCCLVLSLYAFQVIVNHDLFHGAFLLSTAHKANLMAEVRNLLATSGSLVVNMARPVLAHTISAAHSLIHGVETLKSR